MASDNKKIQNKLKRANNKKKANQRRSANGKTQKPVIAGKKKKY